jgi:hypothetical protein
MKALPQIKKTNRDKTKSFMSMFVERWVRYPNVNKK